jgi:single-strand DNA-binding protein
MAGETPITVVGNLTADPELRFTPSGAAVANFTVASTPRTFDRQTNEWKDQETLFLNCSVWRQAAENAAESLTRGMRVIVQGRLKARSYETREGEKRTVFEIDVEEVGPSLKMATAKVQKTSRSGGGQGFGGDDPWASNQGASGGGQGGANQGGANQGGGSWGGSQGGSQGGSWGGNQGGGQSDPWAAPGAAPGGSNDEPPF